MLLMLLLLLGNYTLNPEHYRPPQLSLSLGLSLSYSLSIPTRQGDDVFTCVLVANLQHTRTHALSMENM